jgi:hypothetical protein
LKVVSLDEVKKELGKIWNELLDVFNYYKYWTLVLLKKYRIYYKM